MIKVLRSLLILISLQQGVLLAQAFPRDTSGKITFMEVVDADSMKKEVLYQQAAKWFEASSKRVKVKMTHVEKDSINSKMTGDFQYLVYSQTGILSKISGAVSYTLTIEAKDNRYRYVFNHFVFHYYKQNRNYEYAPTGVTKPLEDLKASGWQKVWNNHRLTAYNKAAEEIRYLKIKMLEKETPAVTPPLANNVKNTDW